MALWKARGGSLNKDSEFRSWHCGRQGGGSLNKELVFRSWHSGRQEGGSLNKELAFRFEGGLSKVRKVLEKGF